MNCLIILNGEQTKNIDIEKIINETDYVICADGGASWANEVNIKVDAIIGDLDSIGEDIKKVYENTGTQIIKAPEEKDETDGVLAIDYAILRGAKYVTILGATGGRLDHQYGNIMLLKRVQNENCTGRMILDKGYAVMSNKYIEITCNTGDTISIVPFDGELVIDSAEGLKYKIDNGTYFSYGYPIGLSNIAVSDTVKIDITGGSALIFCYSL